MHISPSALSTRIKTFEEELGLILFHRRPRGMQLTSQGKTLLSSAVEAIDSIKKFKAKAISFDSYSNVTLKIGMNTSPEFLKMSAINEALAQKMSGLRLQYVTTDSISADRLLMEGDLDLGFVFGENRGENRFGAKIRADTLAMVNMDVVIPLKFIRKNCKLSWQTVAKLPWVWGNKNAACHPTLSG